MLVQAYNSVQGDIRLIQSAMDKVIVNSIDDWLGARISTESLDCTSQLIENRIHDIVHNELQDHDSSNIPRHWDGLLTQGVASDNVPNHPSYP